MRFRVGFGLFGLSENSSFPSTLRAWFAFAHASPYRKSNRNDKDQVTPHPNPPRVGEGTITLYNSFNYATLNQVQSDRKENRHSVLDTESPASLEGFNYSAPCQFVQQCDSGSDLDYSGCRKTHRFPPPYGLGSHSLTHRPTENPTGMTKKQPLPTPALPELGREQTKGEPERFAFCL